MGSDGHDSSQLEHRQQHSTACGVWWLVRSTTSPPPSLPSIAPPDSFKMATGRGKAAASAKRKARSSPEALADASNDGSAVVQGSKRSARSGRNTDGKENNAPSPSLLQRLKGKVDSAPRFLLPVLTCQILIAAFSVLCLHASLLSITSSRRASRAW